MNTNMTIYAQALADNSANYAGQRITPALVGVAECRKWRNAVNAMRIPAYAIRTHRADNMANSEVVAPCDMSDFFKALNAVLDLVGEVNGAKLFPENCAETIIAIKTKDRVIATSEEAAHADNMKKQARAALKTAEEEGEDKAIKAAQEELDKWTDKVNELKALPGNYKVLVEPVSENAFVKEVEGLLGRAIAGQKSKSVEQVLAEEQARKDARKAKAKAKKQAKRQAEAAAK